MRFALRLIQWLGPPERLIELAVLAEQEGWDAVWFPHDPFMFNTWALTSAVAARTSRIEIASIATNPYTTDPSEIATFLATLDLISAGRAAIGIGLHTDVMVGWTGYDAGDRIERTRATVEIVRRLLRGETVSGRIGPFEWQEECFLRFTPLRSDPAVLVAAWDRDYLELSGEIGDGSLPMITPPESAPLMVEPIVAGAERAGRNPKELEISGCAWLSVSSEPAAAAAILRPMAAYFGPYLEEASLATIGLSRADFAPLRELVNAGRLDEASAAVTDDMLRLAIVGTPADVVEQVEALGEAGVTQLNLGGPLGPDPEQAIRLIGREVIPRFR
ncbi:MAG TPA: LLM class flavin-dependent oxidoreductase [Gaiellaceae bacterium]|nr:LLM class flavin-dependent oxidoreductase [Gaiellaceae bacterium]